MDDETLYRNVQAFLDDAKQIAIWAIQDNRPHREILREMIAAETERRATSRQDDGAGDKENQ